MRPVLNLLLLLASSTMALAQEDPTDPPMPGDAAKLTAEFRKQAHAMMLTYEFTLPERPQVKIEFVPVPVLYWTNPEAGNWEGVVYLWTAEGRPAVIASPLHHADRRQMAHEFHQLTESPITGTRNGQVVWRTDKSGVTWAPLPKAEKPAASANARGLQMRAFARRFSAKKTGPEDVVREMRLLPKYVYRNEVQQGNEVIDCACFILSQTTDPEIVLLLEARGDTWFYALARLNQHEFVVRYDDQEVMRFDFVPFAARSNPTTPYTKFYSQLYQDLP